MEAAIEAAPQSTANVQAILAKENWTRDDSLQLYQAMFATKSAADKFRAAVADLLAKNPQPSGAAATKIGIAQYMLGDFETALKSLASGSDTKDRRWYQALLNKQLERYPKAIEEFRKAGDKGWDSLQVKLAIVECQALSGAIDAAAKGIGELSAHVGVSDYQVVLGLVQQIQGQYDQAEDAFGEALELNSNNSSAAFRLAFLYDMQGDEDQAMELYNQCLRTPPVRAHALINLSVLYEDRGEWDKAERCLRALLDIQPNHPRARLFMKDIESSHDMFYDEELERRATQRNAVLDIPVTDFELSVRARNCLKKMEIRSLGDLLRISEADLLAYKNFGETSLAEIKAMLSQKGLRLGQDLEAKQTATKARRPTTTATVGNEGVLATPVSEIELSVRSRKALQRLNAATLGELASRTEAELLACRNFGQTSLNEIKQRLAEYGLGLRDRK